MPMGDAGKLAANRAIMRISDEAELIRLAYAMVVEPHLHHVLAEAIDAHVASHIENTEHGLQSADYNTDRIFSDIAVHYENVKAMLDKQGRKLDTKLGAKRSVENNPYSSALVSADGVFALVNQAGQSLHGWKEGKRPDKMDFSPGHYERLVQSLKSLGNFEEDKSICVVTLTSSGSGMGGEKSDTQTCHYVLTKVSNADNSPVGRLSPVNLSWLPDIAHQFQESFKLTPVELRITQAIVTGQGLSGLAKERGRAIGTVRVQLKTLLSKLSLSSQTELACLYSGFAKVSSDMVQGEHAHTFRANPSRRHNVFTCKNGHKIDYCEIGPTSGTPVLFFNAIILGTAFPANIVAEINKKGLRFILPLRPGIGLSTLTEDGRTWPQDHAQNCLELLDSLKVNRVHLMAENTGVMMAAHVAGLLGSRVLSFLASSPVVPLKSRFYFKAMAKPQRSLYYIARYAPRMVPFIIRSIVAKCDTGYDEEWIIDHFNGSPHDLAVMAQAENKRAARESFSVNYMQGIDGVARELILTGRDWGGVFDDINCPTTFVTGEGTGQFGPAILKDYTKDKPHIEVKTLEDAGYFVLHQMPEMVFEHFK